MIAVERLLSISGEDTITSTASTASPWTGRLPTRFMILTNELPRFTDSSGALASRFVISILHEVVLRAREPGADSASSSRRRRGSSTGRSTDSTGSASAATS